MKSKDYYRYQKELMANSFVEFPSKDELISFVAETVSREYFDYLAHAERTARLACEKRDLEQRIKSEPRLVAQYVKSFLTENIQDTSGKWTQFKAKMLKSQPKKIIFDSSLNTELYDFVIKRLGRNSGRRASKFFRSQVRYTIVGECRLEQKIL